MTSRGNRNPLLDVAVCRGPFQIQKASPHRERARHPHFSAAETEAERLLHLNPGEDFDILQVVARVRIIPGSNTDVG